MKRSTLLLLLSVMLLLLFGVLFSLSDFRLQRAEMAVESTASTYAFGDNGNGSGLQTKPLDLYVRAPAMIESELIQALREELATNPYVGQIELHETPPAAGKESVLVLTMEDPQSLFWTPVYARAALTVDVAYASDGEVEWIGEEVVELRAQEPPAARVVRVRGEYSFADSAYGLISRRGYFTYLAGEMAQTVNQALADTLAAQYASIGQQ